MKNVLTKKELEYLSSVGNITTAAQDNLQALRDIVSNKSHKKIKFKDGRSAAVDLQSANVILTLYDALGNKDSKDKLERMLNNSLSDYSKVFNFAWKKVSM